MIKLFDRPDCKWYILPTESLRDLVIRRMLVKYPSLNYVMTYLDVHGYGVELCHAAWVPLGRIYRI